MPHSTSDRPAASDDDDDADGGDGDGDDDVDEVHRDPHSYFFDLTFPNQE